MNQSILERIPRPVLELARTLDREGERAWVVGGCIRDLLLGRAVHDWDLATSAKPERVRAIFPRTIPTGIAHGTITVLHRGVGYEVTTLRGEGAYSDGRRPDEVFYVDDVREDLERRDFTVNAIAFDPIRDELIDPWKGREDLAAGILRAVRDPRLRFREDGLRILRATRFVATLGMELDPATEAAIPEALDVLAKVSRERVSDEWHKTMKAERPSRAFGAMRRLGIFRVTAPAFDGAPDHEFSHALDGLDRARTPVVRHAALATALGVGESASKVAEATFRELRYSNDERRTITDLVRLAATPARSGLDRITARETLRGIGRERLEAFVELRSAFDPVDGGAWATSAREEIDAGMAFDAKDLAIRGDEIGGFVGRGPAIKDAIAELLRFVDVDPTRNRHESLLDELRRRFPSAS